MRDFFCSLNARRWKGCGVAGEYFLIFLGLVSWVDVWDRLVCIFSLFLLNLNPCCSASCENEATQSQLRNPASRFVRDLGVIGSCQHCRIVRAEQEGWELCAMIRIRNSLQDEFRTLHGFMPWRMQEWHGKCHSLQNSFDI